MAELTLLTATGEASGQVQVSESLFEAPINQSLIHQAATRQLAGRRIGTSSTLRRGEVSGGGAKPWRQKGTGRARQGSRRAPQWKGGGVVFGPHPRSFDQKMPARMRRAALRGVLSAKRAEDAVRVITAVELPEIKTSAFVERLAAWKAEGKVLLVLAGRDEIVERSCQNLPQVRVILADSLNVVDLLDADTIVFTQAALERAQEVYA